MQVDKFNLIICGISRDGLFMSFVGSRKLLALTKLKKPSISCDSI